MKKITKVIVVAAIAVVVLGGVSSNMQTQRAGRRNAGR